MFLDLSPIARFDLFRLQILAIRVVWVPAIWHVYTRDVRAAPKIHKRIVFPLCDVDARYQRSKETLVRVKLFTRSSRNISVAIER